MKKIIALILLLLIVPTAVQAATTAPVWFQGIPTATGEQPVLTIGDDILIYARINNATKNAITYTVSFATPEKVIGTKVTTIAGYSEQSFSIPWKLPQANTLVTATITKAVGTDKKSIPSLIAPIGSVTVSAIKPLEVPPIAGSVKGFIGKGIGYIEAFRLKQLEYFTKLKASSKGVLGETTVNDISTLMRPEVPATPGEPAKPAQIEDGHTTQYVTLVYATIGQSFFSHKALFYAIIVIGVLFVIRFVFRMFF